MVQQNSTVLFGDLAERYLGLTANDLMKKDEQNEKVDCDAINTRLHGKEFNADIRKKKIQTRYGPENQYTIFGLEKIEQLSVGYDTEASSSSYCSTSLSTTSDTSGPSS